MILKAITNKQNVSLCNSLVRVDNRSLLYCTLEGTNQFQSHVTCNLELMIHNYPCLWDECNFEAVMAGTEAQGKRWDA